MVNRERMSKSYNYLIIFSDENDTTKKYKNNYILSDAIGKKMLIIMGRSDILEDVKGQEG